MLTLAWRNLWRRRTRTWMTIGAMVFSNLLLVFMIALQLGSYDIMIENSLKAFSGQLQIARKGYADNPRMRATITNASSILSTLRQTADATVTIAARASTFVLAASDARTVAVRLAGVNHQAEPLASAIPSQIVNGHYLDGTATQAIVGDSLASTLKVSVGDEVTILGNGIDGSFAASVLTITGIFDSRINELDQRLMQINLDDFQTTFALDDQLHSIVVNTTSYRDADELQARLAPSIEADSSLELLDWQTRHPDLQQSIQTDFASAWFMYGVLILLVAFNTLNTQLMSVLERTREFGIMMAVGLNNWRLSRLVMLESLLIACLGLALGLGGGYLLASIGSHVGIAIPGMEEITAQYNIPDRIYPQISFRSILMGPAVVFGFSLLAALYPALRLLRLQPIEAIRAS